MDARRRLSRLAPSARPVSSGPAASLPGKKDGNEKEDLGTSEHKLTIETQPAAGGPPPAPRLELAGYWLEEAGFPVGARVEVVEPGRLVMTRQDLGVPLMNLLPLVWVPVERLAAIETAAGESERRYG